MPGRCSRQDRIASMILNSAISTKIREQQGQGSGRRWSDPSPNLRSVALVSCDSV